MIVNAPLKIFILIALIIGVVCPDVTYDNLPTDNTDEEIQVCQSSPEVKKLAEYRNLSIEKLESEITDWAILRKYNDLPRALLESYYMMEMISVMESRLFRDIALIRPFRQSPSLAEFNKVRNSSTRKEYLMSHDGVLNERGIAVLEATFRNRLVVRPLIAAKLQNDAEIVFEELAAYIRDSDYLALNMPVIIDQFERRVYGNLRPDMRMNRLLNALAVQKINHNNAVLNPVTLLVAYLKWPGFPSERPADIVFEDQNLKQILNVVVMTPAEADYTSQPTSFDNVLVERLTLQNRLTWVRIASRMVFLPIIIVSTLECIALMLKEGLHAVSSSVVIHFATMKALDGFHSAANRYERSLTSTERELLAEHSPHD